MRGFCRKLRWALPDNRADAVDAVGRHQDIDQGGVIPGKPSAVRHVGGLGQERYAPDRATFKACAGNSISSAYLSAGIASATPSNTATTALALASRIASTSAISAPGMTTSVI